MHSVSISPSLVLYNCTSVTWLASLLNAVQVIRAFTQKACYLRGDHCFRNQSLCVTAKFPNLSRICSRSPSAPYIIEMSDALLWEIVRKNNGKSMKRTHPVAHLSLEKGTLMNWRSRHDSGFANTAAVDVSANEDGIPVISLRNQKPEASRNPDKMWHAVTLSGGVRRATAKAEDLLKDYNENTRRAALAKISVIYRAQQRKNRGVDHKTLLSS